MTKLDITQLKFNLQNKKELAAKKRLNLVDLSKLPPEDIDLLGELAALYVKHEGQLSFVHSTKDFEAKSHHVNQLRSLFFYVTPGDWKLRTKPVYCCIPVGELREDVLELLQLLIKT